MTPLQICALLLGIGVALPAAERLAPFPADDVTSTRVMTFDQALQPYDGPVVANREAETLDGRVMCGYQGWFTRQDDGYDLGNTHWGDVMGARPATVVDLWPDLTEYAADELGATTLRHADGTPARIFSSNHRATVLRHFRWMRDYGIGGAFVQRFAGPLRDPERLRHATVTLNLCREGANRYGRSFAVMYDMDFAGQTAVVEADWDRLYHQMRIIDTPAYQRHHGKPLVALWGYGIEGRRIDPAAASRLFAYLKKPENGGCAIMLGTGNSWREIPDDAGGALLATADVISPWTVGRYGSPATAAEFNAGHVPPDLAWCREHRVDYYPVVFPGFSWTNLQAWHGKTSPVDQIPRLGGEFFASQIREAKKYGIDKAYIAMFDEIDEGTAIFKCTNDVPVGSFLSYGGLPSDHYLRLAGRAARFLSGAEANLDVSPAGVK